MGFGALSSAHQIMILLALKGGPEYDAQMEASAATTGRLGKAVLRTSEAMQVATRRSFLHNQALFTARRYAFYATLAVSGLAFEVFRLGMSYNSTVQSARVALKGMFNTRQETDAMIKSLYNLSTFSPFLFKDTLTAFRTMAPAMKNAGIGPQTTLKTLKAIMDGLSQSGRTTTGNLTRIGIQLQHLANIGRPTGQVMLALARDGLPVYPALRKELHLTGTALENIASSGYTAKDVIEALNRFIETSPIYRGQAFKQATQTLQGNWQMFKDILSQASGTSQAGLFSFLTERLRKINEYLQPMVTSGKTPGLYDIAAAIDNALSPSTHLILNLFITFSTTLKTVIFEIGLLAKIVQTLLYPFDKLFGMFGSGHAAARLFGVALGTLVTLFIVGKAVLFPFILMFDLWKAAVKAAEIVAVSYRAVMFVINGEWAAAIALLTGNTAATEANTVANITNTASMTDRVAIMGAMETVTPALTAEMGAATVATRAWNTSLLTLLGTIGLVVAGVAAMVYIANKFHTSIIAGGPQFGHSRLSPAQMRQQHQHDQYMKHGHGFVHWLKSHLNVIGAFQHGGSAGMGGWATVGEHGPELVHLPAASSVHPIPANSLGDHALSITIIPQPIMLNGKQIGTALATAVTDKEARMGGRNT